MIYKNILLIQLKHLGDILLTTPVLRALQTAWPQAALSALIPGGMTAMLSDHPLLREIIPLDRRQRLPDQVRLARELRRRRFDLVLEFSGGDRGAFLAWLTGARTRLGFAHPRRSFWQRRYAFTLLAPAPPLKAHTVEKNLALLTPLGVAPLHQGLEFYWSQETETIVQNLLTRHHLPTRGFVLVHPPARWLFKCWTPTGYAQVIDALQTEYQLPVVLTAAPVPEEMAFVAEIIGQLRTTPINLAGQLDLKSLGALLHQARLFLGVDSAPMHLAAAVGTPTVALFGPSGPYNWRPWGEGHIVLSKDFDCQPCGRDGCDGSKISRCLTAITPDEVLAAVDRQLARCTSPLSVSV